jgi:hypothetical protein
MRHGSIGLRMCNTQQTLRTYAQGVFEVVGHVCCVGVVVLDWV